MNWIELNTVHGFSEDAICKRFAISHARYRRMHPSPDEKLSDGAMLEIYNSTERDLEVLAKRYCCSITQARRATRNEHNLNMPICQDQVKKHYQEGLSRNEIAKVLNITRNQVDVALRKPRGERKALILEALKTMSQAEVAAHLGITQATVSYHATKTISRTNRPKLTVKQWDKLIAAYHKGAIVSELATEFNVSRAAIYRRLSL